MASVLREKILAGQYHVGDRLPTEASLSRDFNVSRITVRQALADLERDGFIRREAGRGTFVAERATFASSMKLEGSLDELISMGLTTQIRVLTLGVVKASAAEAEFLRVSLGDPLVRCTRVRLHGGMPFSYIVNHVPGDIGRRIPDDAWKTGSIMRVMEEELGIRIAEADQTMSAALADPHLARVLKTTIGAPLLSVDRVVRSVEGRPVKHVHTYYRSDVYSFKAHLVHHPIAGPSDDSWSMQPPQRRSRGGPPVKPSRKGPEEE
jgi:GntR family transcriptional regulator